MIIENAFACLLLTASLQAGISVPGCTAYGLPDFDALQTSKARGVFNWQNPELKVAWYGELKPAGALEAKITAKVDSGVVSKFKLSVGEKSHEFTVTGDGTARQVTSGGFEIKAPGYTKIILESLNQPGQKAGDIISLDLDGAAAAGAHFNLLPRRNAASVHLSYKVNGDDVTGFYNEVTAVEDPVYTFYMACGFSRGYLGMQVNHAHERRIIFSVWDAAEGGTATTRDTVSEENHTKMLSHGEGVEGSVFGHEGTGGHSHLVYPWKTGEKQRFFLTAKAQETHTVYSGFWFHPEKKAWMIIASFDAPKDGKLLRGLHSFSENFGGSNGHLRRKCLYGVQWIQRDGAKWEEVLQASFSHDATGKSDRLDRFMGVEDVQFFLSHGGFIEGFTKYGELFTRPSAGPAPTIKLP